MNKRCKHDGIVGAVITIGILLGYYASPVWLLLPGIIGVTLIQSAFTGFCPVYYTLDKLEKPNQLPARDRWERIAFHDDPCQPSILLNRSDKIGYEVVSLHFQTDGSIYISDDYTGSIYRVTYNEEPVGASSK